MNQLKKFRNINLGTKKGFTLIEILMVVGIIAILAAITIIAINPAHQFAQARNAQRWSDVNAILNAVHQRMVDNRGNFSEGTTCDALATTTSTITSSDGAGMIDLCACLVSTYLVAMPYDPAASGASYTGCTDYSTGYTIIKDDTTGRITVAAPSAEEGVTISVSR